MRYNSSVTIIFYLTIEGIIFLLREIHFYLPSTSIYNLTFA